MKSVCVVGAGPGGLVAAKTLLQTHAFKVTVFEQSYSIGGIWAFEPCSQRNAYLGADTPSNLSRNTVGFSDLAWESSGFHGATLRMFPTASDAGKYLEEYRRRYIPESSIRFGRMVVNARRFKEQDRLRWEITTASHKGEKHSEIFDFVVNAAGFFSAPKPIVTPIPQDTHVAVIHTSQFRKLGDIFPASRMKSPGGKILIYGSGNSAGEAAGNVAFHISSALHSPSTEAREQYAGLQVYHVTPRPVCAIPPYVPSSVEKATLVPLDLQFYDLKWRSPGPIQSSSGALSPEKAAMVYGAVQGMIGDQKDLGSDVLVAAEKEAPYVVLSENYAEFVRSGMIVPVSGRVTAFGPGSDRGTLTATVETNSGSATTIGDVVAVIYGTGYTPEPALSFLPDDVKEVLEYDPSFQRLPILLQQHQTINPAVPDLGFIGFYEGPYWGVMEMQARLIAKQWTTHSPLPELPDESLEKLRALREAMKRKASNVPQYWFSDYAGYLEEIARGLSLNREDLPFSTQRDGPATIARYLDAGDDKAEAQKTMADVKNTVDACSQGKYRARAVFRALQGRWSLVRRIESTRPELPSGVFSGTAYFHPRSPTAENADLECLYIEDGTFRTTSDMQMRASRRYVYSYREATDTISVWFVRPDDSLSVDYLFHDLEFGAVEKGLRCTAHSEHLCDPDFYVTEYTFELRAVALERFEIRHHVTGPAKDYVAAARYSRGVPGKH